MPMKSHTLTPREPYTEFSATMNTRLVCVGTVLHSQTCSTCLHAAYKYGKVFSRLAWASLTGDDRFQNKRQEMRQTNRHTSAVSSSDRYGMTNEVEGGPGPHPPFDYDANSEYHPLYCSDFTAIFRLFGTLQPHDIGDPRKRPVITAG